MDILSNNLVCIWRWRLQGPGGNPWVFLFLVLFCHSVVAEDSLLTKPASQTEIADTVHIDGSPARRQWTHFLAYVPEKYDYAFELGSMFEHNSLYWMGFQLGRHLGRCVFSESQTCQQYVDAIGGFGGRDKQTDGMALLGLRWQFIDFPKAYSPSLRVLVGIINYQDDHRDFDTLAYGLSYGWTASVHERVDLNLDFRAGMANEFWSQATLSVHIKMDQWVSYFADKLKQLGGDAASFTGSAIKGTLKTGGEIMGEVIAKPIKKATEATGRFFEESKKEKAPEKAP